MDYFSSLDDFSDVAEETSYFVDIVDWTGEAVSNGFQYINENEWAANFISGAAAGAGAYLLQEDRQKHERELMREKQRFEVDVNTIDPATGGAASGTAYAQGLVGGALTNGSLAQKKVQP